MQLCLFCCSRTCAVHSATAAHHQLASPHGPTFPPPGLSLPPTRPLWLCPCSAVLSSLSSRLRQLPLRGVRAEASDDIAAAVAACVEEVRALSQQLQAPVPAVAVHRAALDLRDTLKVGVCVSVSMSLELCVLSSLSKPHVHTHTHGMLLASAGCQREHECCCAEP